VVGKKLNISLSLVRVLSASAHAYDAGTVLRKFAIYLCACMDCCNSARTRWRHRLSPVWSRDHRLRTDDWRLICKSGNEKRARRRAINVRAAARPGLPGPAWARPALEGNLPSWMRSHGDPSSMDSAGMRAL